MITIHSTPLQWGNQKADSVTVAASGTADSYLIDVTQRAQGGGQFVLEYTLAGSGTATLQYLISHDNTYKYLPSEATDIAAGLTIASGSVRGSIKSVAFTSGGVSTLEVGDVVTGATGGATAKVHSISALSGGTWAGGDAAGTLYVWDQVGTFQNENLNAGRQSNIATIGANTADYIAKDTVVFVPHVAPLIGIRVTETGAANPVVFTGKLSYI